MIARALLYLKTAKPKNLKPQNAKVGDANFTFTFYI